MSGTLQTAIAFPVVFLGIVTLISAGPVLYREVMDSAVFQAEAVNASVANTNIGRTSWRASKTESSLNV